MRGTRRSVLRGIAGGTATVAGLGAAGSASASASEDPECSLLGGLFGGGGDFSTRDVSIESFDGTEIAATVYEPHAEGPHPSVLMTHGWATTKEFMRCYAAMYAERGYVVLAYDSRGWAGTDGVVGVNGPKEVTDAQRLIDWLAAHDDVIADGDNPRVGMDGPSYAGGIQLLTAARDDRIDAIVPRIAWNDLVASGAPNGAIKSGWLSVLVGSGELLSRVTGDWGESIDSDLKSWYAEAMAHNVMPEAAIEYFAARSPTRYLEDLEAPTLVISGWKDTMFPPSEAVANYREIRDLGVESRLLLYGGGHNVDEVAVDGDQHAYANRAAIDWMDRHVRGGDADDVPEISLYDEQADRFRTYETLEEGVDRETVTLSALAGRRSQVAQRTVWFDEVATYRLDGGLTLRGTPELSVTVDADDAPLILFAKLHHVGGGDDVQIDDQVTGFRVESTGTHTFDLDLEPLVREVGHDDALELRIAASDPFYRDESGSATIRNDESTLTLPLADGSI